MRRVHRSAIVPYSPEQMFTLVQDFEHYPQFVPWVSAAQLMERTAEQVVARMEMHRSGLRERFTTRNTLSRPNEIRMQLLEGPFKTLDGRWTFEPIADRGTKVSLTISFEFANPMLSLLVSRAFEKSCGELVDAFVTRARAIYGSS
jgi:ribosome-associated toxin RatA of RatAB toxin-antitoxin module